MLKFILKKSFYHLWDNSHHIIFINLIFWIILTATFYFPIIFKINIIIFTIVVLFSFTLLTIYSAALAIYFKEITDYKNYNLNNILNDLRKSVKPAIFIVTILSIFLTAIFLNIRFYLASSNFVFLVLATFIAWGCIFLLLSIQFFMPLYARNNYNIKKSIRLCIVFFFDNVSLTVSISLTICAIIILSIISGVGLFIAGFALINLYLNVATKLILYKYQYLEKNPAANRKKIPWDNLLKDDINTVGKITFKGLFFPWKQ